MKKKKNNKNILLIITIIIIITSIIYLQSKKISVQTSTAPKEELAVTAEQASADRQMILKDKALRYPKAVELVSPDGYINTDGKQITIKELIGKKVILIDFWTYSCINCIRTLPYLTSWYAKYKDQGLEIIGVHTPEFDFEKVYDNVVRATEKYGINYPVVQDNNYLTWRAYGNQYWPHKYFIDIDGYIVYDHIGEGGYEESEQKIQELLAERAQVLGEQMQMNKTPSEVNATSVEFFKVRTPEIYLGYDTTRGNFGSAEGLKPNQVTEYILPSEFKTHLVYLEGSWKSNVDNLELIGQTGKIFLEYDAKSANIVASADNAVHVGILLDGKPHKVFDVSASDLYNAATADEYGVHTLEIDVLNPGFKIYTFTFG